MTSLSVRVANQVAFGYVPHTTVSGENWQLIAKGATADTSKTAVSDAAITSGGADAYNGKYYIRFTSGVNKGEWSRIVDDDGSGAYTVQGFSTTTSAGDTFEIWKSPEPVVVAEGTPSTTTFSDDTRDEDDNFWVDYYAVPITGNLVGEIQKISAFDKTGGASEGLFTVASAFSQAPAAGDVILLRRFLEVGNVSNGCTFAYEPRRMNRVRFGRGDGQLTVKSGTFGFSTDLYASGATVSAGTNAKASPLSGLLTACGFEETIDSSSNINSSSTAGAVKLDSGSWENHSVGNAVVASGELRFITDLTDGGAGTDTVDVSPNLSFAPAASDIAHACRVYTPTTDAVTLGVVLDYDVDGVRTIMTGCKGNVTLNMSENKVAMEWSFNVDHWVRYNSSTTEPYASASGYYPSQVPVLSSDRVFYVDAGSETKLDVSGLTASLNVETSARSVQGSSGINGRSGHNVVNLDPTLTFRELMGATDELLADNRFLQRDSLEVVLVLGGHENSAGIRIPVGRIIADPRPEDENGLVSTPSVVQAQDAGTATRTGATAAIVRVPNFALALS
jgi:hypothetical protein